MRALTMDEVEVVGGGLQQKPGEGTFYSAGYQNSLADSFAAMAAYSDFGQQVTQYNQNQAFQQNQINMLFGLDKQTYPNSNLGTSYNSALGGFVNSLISYVSDFFGAPHKYNAVSTLVLCTQNETMQVLMAPWMSAPGAPQAQEGKTSQVSLLGGNKISQDVSISEGTIINRSLPDHIFQGAVTTQVTAAYGGSLITTIGNGVAGEHVAMGALNTMVGHLYFDARNIAAQMECDAINGVYVP